MVLKNLMLDNYIQQLRIIQGKEYKLPARIGYAIERNIRLLTEACQEYTARKEAIIKEYGTHNDNGSISLTADNREGLDKLGQLIVDIGTIEHEVDVFKIKIEDFGAAELAPGDMAALMFMIDD